MWKAHTLQKIISPCLDDKSEVQWLVLTFDSIQIGVSYIHRIRLSLCLHDKFMSIHIVYFVSILNVKDCQNKKFQCLVPTSASLLFSSLGARGSTVLAVRGSIPTSSQRWRWRPPQEHGKGTVLVQVYASRGGTSPGHFSASVRRVPERD